MCDTKWFWISLFINRWMIVSLADHWQFLLFPFLPLRSDPLRDKQQRQVGLESNTCCPESLCNAGSCESCLSVLFPTDDCRIKHSLLYHINMLLMVYFIPSTCHAHCKNMSLADYYSIYARVLAARWTHSCPGYCALNRLLMLNYVISTKW